MSLRGGLLLVLLLAATASAQLKVDVALVSVVATVTDSRGRAVEGLRASDFVVEEDGQVQTIAHFAPSNDVPLSVGIVLDSSLSMEPRIRTASNAVSRFVRTLHQDDDVFLMTFDRTPALLQDFTDSRDKVIAALRRVKLTTGTALYDAVDQSLKKVKTGKHEDHALLLITDGQDAGSVLSFYLTRRKSPGKTCPAAQFAEVATMQERVSGEQPTHVASGSAPTARVLGLVVTSLNFHGKPFA